MNDKFNKDDLFKNDGNGAANEDKPNTDSWENEDNRDPFSIENLRLHQNFEEAVGVQKQITIIPVRKPFRQDFIRVRSGDEWRLDTPILDVKTEKESYLVASTLWSVLSDDITFRRLVVTINRQGVVALWPLKLPGADGRLDN